MIKKTNLEIQYLAWCHKTRWVKNKIFESAIEKNIKSQEHQLFFDYEKMGKIQSGLYPIELIVEQKSQKVARI